MAAPTWLRAGALAAALAGGGTACGDGAVSTSEGVEAFNRVAEARQVRLVCPEKVDRGAEEMDCTLHGTKTGKTAVVKMTAMDDKEEVPDAVDGRAFRSAVEQVSQP